MVKKEFLKEKAEKINFCEEKTDFCGENLISVPKNLIFDS